MYGRDPVLQHMAQKSKPTGTIRSPPSYKSELRPSPLSQWTSKGLSPSNQSLAPSNTSSPTSSHPNLTLSRVSSGELDNPGELGPRTPREGSVSEIVLYRETAPKHRKCTFAAAFSFSIHPFVRLSSIPRALQIPLSFIDPELLRVSDATPSELNLSLYVFPPKVSQSHVAYAENYPFSRLAALLHLKKLGIHLTSLKEDAIMRGDISGNAVNPFFVHFSSAIGMHLRAGVGDSPAMVHLHARHSQRALEHMSEADKSDDAGLKVQMLLCVSSACIFQRWFQLARIFLTKACSVLDAADLRFIPVFGRPPELTEEVQERLAVLSQIMYMENYLSLAIDRTPPTMTARIEKEFRHELQVGVLY